MAEACFQSRGPESDALCVEPVLKQYVRGCALLPVLGGVVGMLAEAAEAEGRARSADRGRAQRGLNLLTRHFTTEGSQRS